jgi:uncharacterized protein
VGIEVRESPVSEAAFAEMESFVGSYLAASVENESGGGRMRWYPWHSAEYRLNHIRNVAALAVEIAEEEGADADVVQAAAIFHDVSKLEAEQDRHAEAGALVAREYLESRGAFPASFVEAVCRAVREHSFQGPLAELPLETRCLVEADLLDKVGANGTVLLLLRVGYEARTHMDAAEMVDRVLQRGRDVAERVESDAAGSIAHQRLTRVEWLREWLEDEVAAMQVEDPDET